MGVEGFGRQIYKFLAMHLGLLKGLFWGFLFAAVLCLIGSQVMYDSEDKVFHAMSRPVLAMTFLCCAISWFNALILGFISKRKYPWSDGPPGN